MIFRRFLQVVLLFDWQKGIITLKKGNYLMRYKESRESSLKDVANKNSKWRIITYKLHHSSSKFGALKVTFCLILKCNFKKLKNSNRNEEEWSLGN